MFACRTPEASDVPQSAARGRVQAHVGVTERVCTIENDGLLRKPLHAPSRPDQKTLGLSRHVATTSVKLGGARRRQQRPSTGPCPYLDVEGVPAHDASGRMQNVGLADPGGLTERPLDTQRPFMTAAHEYGFLATEGVLQVESSAPTPRRGNDRLLYEGTHGGSLLTRRGTWRSNLRTIRSSARQPPVSHDRGCRTVFRRAERRATSVRRAGWTGPLR